MDDRAKNKTETEDKKHIRYLRIVLTGVFAFSLIFPAIYREMDRTVPAVKTLDILAASVETKDEDIGAAYDTASEDVGTSGIYENKTAAMPATAAAAASAEVNMKSAAAAEFPLDINFATVSELMQVKGIGEITARNIVDYRNRYGYFYSTEELTRVDGIGEKKLEALSGYIYVDTDRLPEPLPAVSEAASAAAVTAAPLTEDSYEETATAAVTEEEDIPDEEEFVTDIGEDEFADWTETENFRDWLMTSVTTMSFTETDTETEMEYYPVFPLELNSASAFDLTYIKGIGTATAEKIAEYARTVGFVSVDDLLNVSGIGKSKLEMIRPYVYVIPRETFTSVTQWTETFSDTESATTPGICSVNINIGTKEDFMQLPGIDEKLAEEIVALRETIGGFERIEELGAVLSNEKLKGIWNYVYVPQSEEESAPISITQ